jgi:hypothetical protein
VDRQLADTNAAVRAAIEEAASAANPGAARTPSGGSHAATGDQAVDTDPSVGPGQVPPPSDTGT